MSCPRGQQGQCLHQVEATLQQPAARAPAIAPDSGSSESNSIGAEIRKQLDLVGEQLASKVCLFLTLITALCLHFVAANML